MVGEQRSFQHFGCHSCVLNALRHLWLVNFLKKSLNVSKSDHCAQRLTASMVGEHEGNANNCSEFINALRHLWLVNIILGISALLLNVCSTPYGIYGW